MKLALRGAIVVDGTGSPWIRADVLVDGRRHHRGRRHRRKGAADEDGRPDRARAGARIHRPAHALRRPGALGPRPHPVVLARRHDRRHGQLRLRHRPGLARRPRAGDAHPRKRRGHAAGGVAGRASPGPSSPFPNISTRVDARAAALQRRGAVRPHAAALLRHGRGGDRAGRHPRRSRHGCATSSIEGMAAGAIGFSTSRSESHRGAFGRPVPSRLAELSEIWTLAGGMSARPGKGTIEATWGPDFHVEECARLAAGHRPARHLGRHHGGHAKTPQ